jgi:hypothetical protein
MVLCSHIRYAINTKEYNERLLKMIKKIKILLVILATFGLIAIPAAASADTIGSALTCGTDLTNAGGGCTQATAGNSTSSISTLINEVITVFSWIVGSISIIMIIYGGFRYVTSGGNDASVSGAKNTIIYALIGLVIVALAQVIVHFVLAKAETVNTSNGGLILLSHLFR